MMRAEKPVCSWSQSSTLQYLQKFLYQTQIEDIDDHSDALYDFCGEDEQTPEQVVSMLKFMMDNSGGSLGIYGPVKFFYADLYNFFEPTMSEGYNYVDSKLLIYIPKQWVFPRCCQFAMPQDMLDSKLSKLLLDTYSARIAKQLKGTFEIVSIHAFELLARTIQIFLSSTENKDLPFEMGARKWNAMKPEERLRALLVFWKFANDESDKHIKKGLEEFVLSAKISHKMFVQVQRLQMLLEFIVLHDYIFNTFEAAEKKKCDGGKKFETFIRLFHDGNKKFLFLADVCTELQKALKKKSDGQADRQLPSDILEANSDFEIKQGRYFVIPYSRYLEIVDELQIGRDTITLVNVEVKRSRHLASPIISPYGTPCKLAADVFNEIMGILTIELQAWWRLVPHQVPLAKRVIMDEMSRLIVRDDRDHLISESHIKKISDRLRYQIDDMLGDFGAPFQEMEEFPEGQKSLTLSLLHQEIERLDLAELFPYIIRAVDIVFAKNIRFKGPTLVTRLDLTMMIQECVSLCLLRKTATAKMTHIWELCDFDIDYSCHFCHRTSNTTIPPGAEPTVRCASDFQIKYDKFNFGEENVTYATLIDKMSRKKLVTSEMAHSFVFHVLLQCPMKNLSDAIEMAFSNDVKNMWRKGKTGMSVTEPVSFYMTDEEMLQLSAYVKEKYSATPTRKQVKEGMVDLKPGQIVSDEAPGIKEWMMFVDRSLESLTSFAEIFPDRKFFLKIKQQCNLEKDEKEDFVNSGELLEAVNILMKQKKIKITINDFAKVEKLKKQYYHSEIGWIFIPIKDALSALKDLPVNPERFSFVPDVEKTPELFNK